MFSVHVEILQAVRANCSSAKKSLFDQPPHFRRAVSLSDFFFQVLLRQENGDSARSSAWEAWPSGRRVGDAAPPRHRKNLQLSKLG